MRTKSAPSTARCGRAARRRRSSRRSRCRRTCRCRGARWSSTPPANACPAADRAAVAGSTRRHPCTPALERYTGGERHPRPMSNAHVVETSGAPPGWPRPPFDWPHHEPAERPGSRACRIDTMEGRSLPPSAREIDPGARDWFVGAKADGPFVALSLARVARLTLSAPLYATVLSAGRGPARIPVAELGRDYTLRTTAGRELLRGRPLGRVDTDDGVFLFTAQPGEVALNRVFVPRAAQL